MAKIIDIRGTHGSGKSTLVHQLIQDYDFKPIRGIDHRNKEDQIGLVSKNLNAAILGKYKNVCGGCDGIGKADEIVRRVVMFAEEYDYVILEGILVSHTFKRYNDLANQLKEQGHDYVFMFLSTPLKVCISRVKKRREERGDTKPFDPKNVIHDHKQIWERTREKMIAADQDVVEVNWRDPYPEILQELDLDA